MDRVSKREGINNGFFSKLLEHVLVLLRQECRHRETAKRSWRSSTIANAWIASPPFGGSQ